QPQQDRDGDGRAADRRDDAGAGRLAHRRGRHGSGGGDGGSRLTHEQSHDCAGGLGRRGARCGGGPRCMAGAQGGAEASARRAGSKPLLIEGLNTASGEWETPLAGQRYGELQAGVQLANRSGALNEIEYSEFVQKVQAFAEAIGAMADFPDMLDVVARARELDAFAGEHDAQLAVHLQARSAAWSVGYIQQHASRHGFVAGAVPGRLVLPSTEEGAPPVLTLTFDSQAALA